MEEHADLQVETKASKFSRLVHDEEIDQFVLYWPFGANRTGLDIEIGFILEKLRRGEITGENVRVLIEDDGPRRRAVRGRNCRGRDLHVRLVREGAQVNVLWRYSIPFGAILTGWASYEELFELLKNAATD